MISRYVFRSLCILLAIVITSCQHEEVYNESSAVSGSGLCLTFDSNPMQQYNVTSRSSDAKEDEEKSINQLYIFFFQSDGNWLEGTYLEGYKDASGAIEHGGYISPGQGSTIIKIANEKGYFNYFEEAKTANIYAVANVETSLFSVLDDNGRPKLLQDIIDGSNGAITTPREALRTIVYKPKSFIFTELPSTGMPMVSEPTEIDLTGTTGQNEEKRIIQMKALMSRIDFSIRLESEIEKNSLPSMLMTNWKVSNLPTQVSFSETDLNGTTSLDDDTKTFREVYSTQVIYNKEGKIEFSFYMFENIQQAEWIQDEGESWVSNPGGIKNESYLYPSGIKEYQKQHYKPYLANKNAAYVEICSQYTTYNNATYTIEYTLYLGSNHTDNFAVARNRQYKNNIVIKGLTQAGTNPEHVTFDARVNVTEQNNNYYISILNEQNHDAHFCVTPMDVYFFNLANNPSMKIKFLNNSDLDENGEPWIRMEVVDCEIMRTGTGFDADIYSGYPSDKYGEWHAGNGKRKYFTTDLVTNTLKDSGKEVTIDNSRDRVYFYIDENLSDTNDRYASVYMEYYENGELKGSRTLELKQLHFLKVQVYDRYGDKSDYKKPYDDDNRYATYGFISGESPVEDGVIYMEQIEEYLEHYDPLDKFDTEQIYEGLPWGLSGERVSNFKNWLNGLYYTGSIVEEVGQEVMTLNDIPNSAAAYCYNRNKREKNGSVYHVVKGNWPNREYYTNRKYFLPGIRQMEDALTQYYTVFDEFKDNYYWSSASGENSNMHARATRSDENGVYASSSPNADYPTNGGYALRTEDKIRIRAFRSDLEPLEY